MHRVLAVSAALAAAACSDDPSKPAADLEACSHLATGPFQALFASAERGSAAPGIDDDDVAYRVNVAAGGGFVFFGTDAAGSYGFFADADVLVEVTDSFGEAVEVERATSSSACDDIAGRYVATLEVGTYFLELAEAAPVTIVVEPIE